VDYVFSPSAKADLSDIDKDVAIENVKRIKYVVQKLLERFENSPKYHILCYENEWINHPDEYFVSPGVFKNVFINSFGDIYLQHFLTEYKFDSTSYSMMRNFNKTCDFFYSKNSYD
jgi:hypothetical protein